MSHDESSNTPPSVSFKPVPGEQWIILRMKLESFSNFSYLHKTPKVATLWLGEKKSYIKCLLIWCASAASVQVKASVLVGFQIESQTFLPRNTNQKSAVEKQTTRRDSRRERRNAWPITRFCVSRKCIFSAKSGTISKMSRDVQTCSGIKAPY